MGIHEIQEEREAREAKRIARPARDDEQQTTEDRQKGILRLPRGFTDLDTYMAMMRRLNRLRHKRATRHWGPGGHKPYERKNNI